MKKSSNFGTVLQYGGGEGVTNDCMNFSIIQSRSAFNQSREGILVELFG